MLLSRQYNPSVINAAFKKLEGLKRLEVLKKVVRKKADRVVLALRYHPALPAVSEMISKHYKTMTNTLELKEVFPKPPMVAYKQPPNLRRLLVRANLPSKARSKRIIKGTKPCTHSCGICNFIKRSPEIVSTQTGEKFKCTSEYTCMTKGVIYVTTCSHCRMQYVGQSKRRLVDRIKEHSYDIRSNQNTANGIHYNSASHTIDNFKVQVIEKVVPNTPHMLLQREHWWIQKLQSKKPNGLNDLD